MTHRLPDEEQIKIVVKNLSPQYYHHMAIQYFLDFNHLIKTGTQIEDALSKGLRSRVPSDSREGKRPIVAPKEVHNMNTAPPARRVNFGEGRPERKEPRRFDPLPYSLSVALKKLLRDKKIELLEPREAPNPLPRYWRKDYYCEYHQGVGHLTDRCMALKHKIQDMIEAKKISVETPNVTRNPLPTHATPPPNVYAILTEEVVLDYSRICSVISEEPYVLRWEEGDSDTENEKPYVLSARAEGFAEPAECSYVLRHEEENNERIPYVLRLEDEDLSLLDDQCDELRHVTRGGRVFKPAELRVENPAEVARGVDHQKQKQKLVEEEDNNLLNQLKKTQANVSIWGLLMASPKHRQVVLHELNSSQVSVEITPDELVSLVAATRVSQDLSFTDEDLPPEGRDHVRPLRITIICNKKRVPEVLIDNGSALNVCPLSTATTLGFGPEDFIPSEQGILAYDGTRRGVIGTLATEVEIGGETFEVEFQKLRFIRNNRIITVRGDPEPEVGQITAESVDENVKDVSLTGFSLEVSTITMAEAMKEGIMFLSSTNVSVARMMRRFGYVPGAGLGRNLQGLTEWPLMKTINGLFGLGYQPTRKEVQEMKAYMLRWAACRRRGVEFPMGPFSMVMNGRFRREGADCPFYGFSEPWYDETGKKLPGTIEVGSTSEVGDESILGGVESEFEDVLVDSLSVHVSHCVDTDVDLFFHSVSESVKPAVGYFTDTKEARLISYHTYLASLVSKFRNVTFTHLSRTRNHFADALATLASMLDISATMEVQPLAVRLQWAPAHVNAIEISARATSKYSAGAQKGRKGQDVCGLQGPQQGYSQIKMEPEDMIKTAFTTQWGTYYYRVMPFGLKNAENQSDSGDGTAEDREANSWILGESSVFKKVYSSSDYDMRAYFKLLKKNSSKKWTEECQVAFEKIKQCLSLPPVLSPVILGQPLLLYLSRVSHYCCTCPSRIQ
ncbi:uncharacterized protein LOC143885899 [Tasmannia lanceolata]|uniref:uncharacterized protein LOC143885899 n=1 Tax=Tasmannia lanceolata TaxID=3420 RepID=UPI0040648DCC